MRRNSRSRLKQKHGEVGIRKKRRGGEGCGRRNGARGWLWMVAKKRCARVEAPSFPTGDLELVIKYKEPCFASSRMESARAHRLFPFPPPSSCIPFRYARNTERAVFNSRLHSIYFDSRIRRCRTSSKRPTDAISAIAWKTGINICRETQISRLPLFLFYLRRSELEQREIPNDSRTNYPPN